MNSDPGPNRRFLLVSRIGLKSYHRRWLAASVVRNFDVLLSSYDLSLKPVKDDGVIFEHRVGRKVAGIAEILHDHQDLLKRYEYVAFFDDDLDTTPEQINAMFALCADHGFKICQPALTANSYFTYAGLIQQRAFKFRYVTYIEMMCPIFRVDTLFEIAPLFGLGYESGIDLIWCNLVAEGPDDFAVLDATPLRHTGPVGANKSANGFTEGRRYEDDIYAVLDQFGLPWLPLLPYAAVNRAGRRITSRLKIIAEAAKLVAAVPKQRGVKSRARAVAVHMMHLLTRTPENRPVSLAKDANYRAKILPELP